MWHFHAKIFWCKLTWTRFCIFLFEQLSPCLHSPEKSQFYLYYPKSENIFVSEDLLLLDGYKHFLFFGLWTGLAANLRCIVKVRDVKQRLKVLARERKRHSTGRQSVRLVFINVCFLLLWSPGFMVLVSVCPGVRCQAPRRYSGHRRHVAITETSGHRHGCHGDRTHQVSASVTT